MIDSQTLYTAHETICCQMVRFVCVFPMTIFCPIVPALALLPIVVVNPVPLFPVIEAPHVSHPPLGVVHDNTPFPSTSVNTCPAPATAVGSVSV